MNTFKNWFQTLKTDPKKRILVIVITTLLVIAILITGIVLAVKKQSNPSVESVPEITDISQQTTDPETETTTEIETTTEAITEVISEPKTEAATKQQTPSQSTKKPAANNPKPQQKPQNNVNPPLNNNSGNNMSQSEKMKIAMEEQGVSSEAEYWKKVEKHKNYKCPYCGSSSCQSIAHNYDALGNPYSDYYNNQKPCPVFAAGKAKCPNCGKILVDDNRWLTEPDKYCDGFCTNTFG